MDESLSIVQPATPVKGALAEVRTDFIKKVYGIVICMCLVTFGLASPFVFNREAAKAFIIKHWYIVLVCMVLLLVQHIFHLCMTVQMCCSANPTLFIAYMKMFKTVPQNYIYLFVYATVLGVLVGVITIPYTAPSVCFVFLLCAAIIVALTVYAVKTKSDFTGMGAYIMVALFGLSLTMMIGFFIPIGSMYHRIIGGIGATIFGFIIVYDTQLIFGSASSESRELEYTIDMYAYAAFELYLDFINFFLYMLQALGERD